MMRTQRGRQATFSLVLGLLSGCGFHAAGPRVESKTDDPWSGVALPPISTPLAPSTLMRTTRDETPLRAPGMDNGIEPLLPRGVRDPAGWSQDIRTAMEALAVPLTRDNLCAAIAVIAQESSFQAEPVVPGLPSIIRKELEKRRSRYHVPQAVLDAALAVRSPDGRRYEERINALRTENDLNRLYDDMLASLPLGKTLFGHHHPVKTGGPMQVSLAFAEQQETRKPSPYQPRKSLREEVFSRRGGVYYGIAYLLDYPTHYDRMLWRFADYNAGRYTSRNAGFQQALRTLSGHPLTLDGDLLRYDASGQAERESEVIEALESLGSLLPLSPTEIREDLAHEKEIDFEGTRLWAAVNQLLGQRGLARLAPRLPEIRLISPKITSGLTTAGFAQRVNARYKDCLAR